MREKTHRHTARDTKQRALVSQALIGIALSLQADVTKQMYMPEKRMWGQVATGQTILCPV